MSCEQNIAIVRRYYDECANDPTADKQRALVIADEILSTDFAMSYNNTTPAEAPQDIAKHKEFFVGHARALPGEHWTIEEIVADEQTVACQWRVRATHAETGNSVDLRGADFFTVRNGELAKLHRFLDFQPLTRQMQPIATQQSTSTAA